MKIKSYIIRFFLLAFVPSVLKFNAAPMAKDKNSKKGDSPHFGTPNRNGI
jgi:hypothetical protein